MASVLDRSSVTLNSNNYGRWKVIITSLLEAKEVLDVVDGTRVRPAELLANDLRTWKKADATARVILISSLDDEHEKFVRGCSTSKQIWDTLSRLKQSTSQPNIQLAWQQLHGLSWDGTGSIAGYLASINEATEKLKSLGKEPDETSIIGKVISSLPAKFTNFRTTWNMTRIGEEVTLLQLQSALLAAEADMASSIQPAEQQHQEDADSVALTAGRRMGKKKSGHGQGNKRKVICFNCRGEGHIKADCPSKGHSAGGNGASGPRGGRKPGGAAMMAGTDGDCWFGDSGAFRHMTHHEEWFAELRPAEEKVTIGDGTVLTASGIGSIHVETFNGKDWEPHTLTDVLLVPVLVVQSPFTGRCDGERVHFSRQNEQDLVRAQWKQSAGRNWKQQLVQHEDSFCW